MGYSLASSLPSLLSVATHLILNELKDASQMRNKKPCISNTDRNTQSYSCEAPYGLRWYLDTFQIEDMMYYMEQKLISNRVFSYSSITSSSYYKQG